jgi:hypothetical protein
MCVKPFGIQDGTYPETDLQCIFNVDEFGAEKGHEFHRHNGI